MRKYPNILLQNAEAQSEVGVEYFTRKKIADKRKALETAAQEAEAAMANLAKAKNDLPTLQAELDALLTQTTDAGNVEAYNQKANMVAYLQNQIPVLEAVLLNSSVAIYGLWDGVPSLFSEALQGEYDRWRKAIAALFNLFINDPAKGLQMADQTDALKEFAKVVNCDIANRQPADLAEAIQISGRICDMLKALEGQENPFTFNTAH